MEQIAIDLYRTHEAPDEVGGMISKQGDRYMIIINANKSSAEQLASFLHEMTHVFNHDLDGAGGDVAEIETRTRRQLREALQAITEQEGGPCITQEK